MADEYKIKNGVDLNGNNIKNILNLTDGVLSVPINTLGNKVDELLVGGSNEQAIKLHNNTMLNAFRIMSSNSLSILKMIDGIADEYIDESGIDTASSTNEVYNSGGDYYSPSLATNMTLISEDFISEFNPEETRTIILFEEVDSITLNTDIILSVSKDGGSNWTVATLVDEGNFVGTRKILTATTDVDYTGLPSGTTMKYKIETFNNKNMQIHASSLSWK